MAFIMSPMGLRSDDEEEMAVFESTAAEYGGIGRPRLPEISLISPGLDIRPFALAPPAVKPPMERQGSGDEGNVERVQVFLRIRPLTEAEKEKGEEQGCVAVQDEQTLLLSAPKDSRNMKMAEKGISQCMHKFSFSKIFPAETTQQEFYEHAMKSMVNEVLKGENRLLYTYGVTNSGKTYTIQGTGREAGLLPRALASLFGKLQGRLYSGLDLKPVLYQDVRHLEPNEVHVEEMRRNSLLNETKNMTRNHGTTTTWDSGIGGISSTSNIPTQLGDGDSVDLEPDSLSHSGGDLQEGVQFSIWVSFFEIYNEFLYDLLEAAPSQQPKKRTTLKLSDDKHGNPYVKDLSWIQVRSAEEAWKVLRAGQRNQSFACTHLNLNSSRSHSIFSIRVLHINPEADSSHNMHISELTVCDLAGSERCKEQRNGERMKEANNINASLLTLGRCINALRQNQKNKTRPPQVVPFRESKLTRVLQGFFCGKGTSSMVVNINPCSSIYDETLQALKFSAIASQLVHGPSTKTRVAYILSLLHQPAGNIHNESTILEDDDSDVEDGDISMLDTESLLRAIDVLKGEVHRQREEKACLEGNIREQVVSEMRTVMDNMREGFSETLEAQCSLIQERSEERMEILQKYLKEFYGNQLKERDEEIAALTAELENERQSASLLTIPKEPGSLRRSKRTTVQTDVSRLQAEMYQCQEKLSAKTLELKTLQMQLEVPASSRNLTMSVDRKMEEGQRNLRQLRLDLQRLCTDLQSGERACCRNTGGNRLRQALSSADVTLAKQCQILLELQNSLTLVKADLRQKADQTQAVLPPAGSTQAPLTGSCKRRGCAAASRCDTENNPPQKRPFLESLFHSRTPTRKYNMRSVEQNVTPYTHILRSRQQSPPRSPLPSHRVLRGKF